MLGSPLLVFGVWLERFELGECIWIWVWLYYSWLGYAWDDYLSTVVVVDFERRKCERKKTKMMVQGLYFGLYCLGLDLIRVGLEVMGLSLNYFGFGMDLGCGYFGNGLVMCLLGLEKLPCYPLVCYRAITHYHSPSTTKTM